MKNIIIAGIPRAGKTTLAKRLFKNLTNYNLIEEDILNSALMDVYKYHIAKPDENGILNINLWETNQLCDALLKRYVSYLNNCEKDIGVILDTYSLKIGELKKFSDKGDIVVVLGISSITAEEFFKNIRKYDTCEERTFYQNDFMLMNEIECYIQDSCKYKKQCDELGLVYIDTSTERDKRLDEAYQIILKKINNG